MKPKKERNERKDKAKDVTENPTEISEESLSQVTGGSALVPRKVEVD